MQLYYLTLHVWLSGAAKLGIHPTEAVVRLPSVIFAALSSVGVYLLGRRFLGQTAGVLSASLYSLSFYVLMVAQQTRSYSMQMLFIIAAWYMFFGALDEEGDTRWWWALYTLFTTLALYAHLFSFFMSRGSALLSGGAPDSAWRLAESGSPRGRARAHQPRRDVRPDPAAGQRGPAWESY